MKNEFRLLFICFVVFALTKSLHAQQDNGRCVIPDSLLVNSSFYLEGLVNRYSNKQDSSNASNIFLKINPYLFICRGYTPSSLTTLYKRYRLTRTAELKYQKIFSSAYSGRRSPAYLKFEKMCDEDQMYRDRLSSCKDSFECTKMLKLRRTNDSLHFETLYKYVRKNGWPTLENGSSFAEIIAIHDHRNHPYYLPYLRKAAIEGHVSVNTLELMCRYRTSDSNSIADLLSSPNALIYDVSSLLYFQMPDSSTQASIRNDVQKFCHIQYRALVFQSPNKTDATDWFNEFVRRCKSTNEVDCIIPSIAKLAQSNNCPNDGAVQLAHMEIKNKPKKIYLILLH